MKKNGFSKLQESIVGSVRLKSSQLRQQTNREIRNHVDDLRERVFSKSSQTDSIVESVLAISNEAIRRVLGLEFYDVQILASNALIHKQIAEMQTGEGKTISAVPAAVYGGILGKGSHITTPNNYLASRDFEQLKEVYECLGLTTGLLDSDAATSSQKRDAYACDITYGPGYEFGFDYLRDQLLLKERDYLPTGRRLLDCLEGKAVLPPAQTRGLGFCVVDEADNVLIDDAMSPQILSEFQPGEATDRDAVLLARRLAAALDPNAHFRETGLERIELTADGVEAIHNREVDIPVRQLIRPWTQYVEAALKAELFFRRDVQYILVDNEVRIVDQSTGRIFEDRSWQAGLHQAVEAKEGVLVTPESLPLAQITRQRFYRLYEHLAGMTGTASNCKTEFKTIYDMVVTLIPLRVESNRSVLPMKAFDCFDRKWDAIARSIGEFHDNKRPVLIGTRTILESQILANLLELKGLDFELLNGTQTAAEADIIAKAGMLGAITIATNLAGRGTDIKLENGVRALGGLHVIVAECHSSARIDRQLVGRCARQGDPGSCQTFISADDWLLVTYASWLSESLKKISVDGATQLDLEPKVRKIQGRIERAQFAQRLELLRTTTRQNEILKQVYAH